MESFARSTPATEVKVVKGDTLSAIAKRMLGDENRWEELFEANRDKLRDPHRLAEGMTIRMPGAPAPEPAKPLLDLCDYKPSEVPSRDDIVKAVDEAEKFVRKALELRPDSSAFLDSLGMVLFKKGQLDAARDTLERAIDGGPDDATLFEHLGDVAAKAGDRARAQQSYSRALKALTLNPDDAERLGQREDLERKLKLLTPGGKGR